VTGHMSYDIKSTMIVSKDFIRNKREPNIIIHDCSGIAHM